MKLALIVAASLLASCKDKPRAAAPPPSPGSAAPAPAAAAPVADAGAGAQAAAAGVCQQTIAALERSACPTPDAQKNLRAARKSIDQIVAMVGTTGAEPHKVDLMCAKLVAAIERDATKLGCTLPFEPGQRAHVAELLDAWYGQRTPVTPTGDAAADAVIAKIAAVRDAACACKDAPCLDRLDKQLGGVGEMPATAPEAARTLGVKLLEDAGRCAERVRTLAGSAR